MAAALILLASLTLLISVLLFASIPMFRAKGTTMIDAIDNALPQTQCGQCGYAGCRPYAQAIARGEADINQCPPGGEVVIRELALLLGTQIKPLDEAFGVERPRDIAVIDEDICIGCKKCIQVCPVDAILGAPKLMHTVISDECTGCDLCPPACPVDCIDMIPAVTGISAWTVSKPIREPQARAGT
ncbi:MAG: electron transport complex subunit RsxB [Gammaproteobacteria bacterium]|nr:electron transport complex subunit RsxB [Gammaproteobacteria bacterium]MDH3769189.1 electron transport complex subunit RsxB [Gammaproteobacteria bacterium]